MTAKTKTKIFWELFEDLEVKKIIETITDTKTADNFYNVLCWRYEDYLENHATISNSEDVELVEPTILKPKTPKL